MNLLLLGDSSARSAVWVKSTRSAAANCCIEVKDLKGQIAIRDSKYRSDSRNDLAIEPVIFVSPDAWSSFLQSLITGSRIDKFENLLIRRCADDFVQFGCADDGVWLNFTGEEWTAFEAGVKDGELSAQRLAAV